MLGGQMSCWFRPGTSHQLGEGGQHGADLERDDGLDQWFTPIHNAVANGAKDVVECILVAQPRVVNLTTGDGPHIKYTFLRL